MIGLLDDHILMKLNFTNYVEAYKLKNLYSSNQTAKSCIHIKTAETDLERDNERRECFAFGDKLQKETLDQFFKFTKIHIKSYLISATKMNLLLLPL